MTDQHTHSTHPGISVTDIQRLAAPQLSLPSRVGHALLLLVSLTMAVAIASLLVTEPALPARARIAFIVLIGIGVAWAVFAAWVLSTRRVMFGRDRLIAARMAVAFTLLSTLGMLAAGVFGDAGLAAYVAAACESALLVAAGVLLVRAKKRVRDLSVRKQALEQQLALGRDLR